MILGDGEKLNGDEGVVHQEFVPFVQRQRYTSIEKLRKAKNTKDL